MALWRDVGVGSRRGSPCGKFLGMTAGQPDTATKPSAQLPQGPYPVSSRAVWAVAVLVALTGVMLGVAVPTVLSPGESDGGEQVATVEVTTGSPEGGAP